MVETTVTLVYPGTTIGYRQVWQGKSASGNSRHIKAHFAGIHGAEIQTIEHANVEGVAPSYPQNIVKRTEYFR